MRRSSFSKAHTAITKNDMARVIVQALWNLPTLPAADDKRVTRRMRWRKDNLETFYKLGLKIIRDGLAKGTWPTVDQTAVKEAIERHFGW